MSEKAEASSNSRAQACIKVGLSLAVLFQLFCVSFGPNRNAYLRARFSGFTDPYTNFMGLASTWSFFAPEPGPPPLRIEYEIYNKEGASVRKGVWPDPQVKYLFGDRGLRRGAATQFMLSHPEYAVNMLVPYFCQAEANVGSVRLWASVSGVPNIEDVASGKRQIGDDVDSQKKSLGYDFCTGA